MTFQQFPNTRQTAGSGTELAALQSFITWTQQQLDPFQWEYDPIELQAYDLQERLYFQIIPPDGDGTTFKYHDWGVQFLDRYFSIMSHFGIKGTYVSIWLDICQCIIAKLALVPNYSPVPAAKRRFPVPYTLPAIAPIVGLQDGMLELTSRRYSFTPDEQQSFVQAVLETQYLLEHEYPEDTPMPATLTRLISNQDWTFHFTRAVLVAHLPITYGQVIVALGTVARYGTLYEAIDRSHVWMEGDDYGELWFTQDAGQGFNGNVSSVLNVSDASSAGLVATT
ncbi:MAG: hypothetical protein OHK93_004756 [Ramalina farinacea]|uniref:Uncharacterized protein n=1 Tax=Ramalina farinacea TaxID=258253 RepID=A0AA43QV22_9LECA|nr:hypothetical protein [Ramalina farinacea]